MIGLGIVIVIVIGVVCSVGLVCYFGYKKQQEPQMSEISVKALMLEIERENTKQMELDKDAFKEKEKTKQYEIRSSYKDKHDSTLY